MTGFEPQTSGIGSDCSTNWATTTAQNIELFWYMNMCRPTLSQQPSVGAYVYHTIFKLI